jgi:hypothetical protein
VRETLDAELHNSGVEAGAIKYAGPNDVSCNLVVEAERFIKKARNDLKRYMCLVIQGAGSQRRKERTAPSTAARGACLHALSVMTGHFDAYYTCHQFF